MFHFYEVYTGYKETLAIDIDTIDDCHNDP